MPLFLKPTPSYLNTDTCLVQFSYVQATRDWSLASTWWASCVMGFLADYKSCHGEPVIHARAEIKWHLHGRDYPGIPKIVWWSGYSGVGLDAERAQACVLNLQPEEITPYVLKQIAPKVVERFHELAWETRYQINARVY